MKIGKDKLAIRIPRFSNLINRCYDSLLLRIYFAHTTFIWCPQQDGSVFIGFVNNIRHNGPSRKSTSLRALMIFEILAGKINLSLYHGALQSTFPTSL